MNNTKQSNCQNMIQAGASHVRPKEEPEKFYLMEDAHISLWNSLESDTESLAQEKRYQIELQTRIHQAKEIVNRNGERDTEELEESSVEEDGDDENDLEEFEAEDNYIYDSLDVAAPQQREINSVPLDTEVGEILREKREDMLGDGPVEDEYAALRYDPNWRTKLKGDGLFEEGTQLLQEEDGSSVYISPGDDSLRKARDHSRNAEQKNRSSHRQVPAVAFAAGMEKDCCSESKSKPPPTPYDPPLQSSMGIGAETAASELWRPQEAIHHTEGTILSRRLRAVPASGNQTCSGENQVICHEQEESYEEMNERYAKEYQLFYEQQSAHTDETASNNQDFTSVYYQPNQSRRLSNMRLIKPKKDIVERNKVTLGIRTKQASYLCAHSQKGVKEDPKNKEEAHQLLVPCPYVSRVLYLAHTHLLGGHLGVEKMYECILTRFYWPGVKKVVENYCRSCPERQLRSPQQEPVAVEEIIQHQYLDPELRWQQKTHRLKVHRGKKTGKREGVQQCPALPTSRAPARDQNERNPGVPQDGRAPRARAHCRQLGHAEVLVIDQANPGDTPLSPALPAPQWRADRSPYAMNAPTLNLNINLSASRDTAPFQGQGHERTGLKLSPPHGPQGTTPSVSYHVPTSGHYDPAQVAYCGPDYLSTVPQPAMPTDWFAAQQIREMCLMQQGSRRMPREVPPLWDHGSHPLPGMDRAHAWITPAMFQPPGDRNPYLSPGDQHVQLWPPHRLPAQSPGSYTVLPPIEGTVASDSELSSQNTRQKLNGMHRSSSEGYLAQLEKQKQLKEKTTYKAYTLKDYKALKQDVKLGGLGPNHIVTPITAEKIRRRREYSDKVREQNKNVSRIPFLPARNQGGGDSAEYIILRKKALEYARSIPKPKPPAEPKSSERVGTMDLLDERARYLQPLDLSQLARLEMLQKRHEEEKQVVAHFKALRVV